MSADSLAQAQSAITKYYRIHARVYDLTRWTFLRGREDLIYLAAVHSQPLDILEVGCGTGKNLLQLGRLFPEAHLWGLDLSPHMLGQARRKLRHRRQPISFIEAAYDQPLAPKCFDLLIFSYALSMFNPGWEEALLAASDDLSPGGAIAVVDFHDSPSQNFKRWMGVNHVRLDAHLLPRLRDRFSTREESVLKAFGGLWSYFLFVGTNQT